MSAALNEESKEFEKLSFNREIPKLAVICIWNFQLRLLYSEFRV